MRYFSSVAVAVLYLTLFSADAFAECSSEERADMLRAGKTPEEIRTKCTVAEQAAPRHTQAAPDTHEERPERDSRGFIERYKLGLAYYASEYQARNAIGDNADDKFEGNALVGTAVISDSVAIRVVGAKTDNELGEDAFTSLEGSLMFGAGFLKTEDIHLFASIGSFYDQPANTAVDAFTGLQAGVGLGAYLNQYFVFDAWINFKSSSDYQAAVAPNLDFISFSYGLGVSAMF